MDFYRERFKSLVHYVCWRCKDNTAKLGSTKLNKTLWLSDFTRYYFTGTPITGARYVKQRFGPVPKAIMPVLRELEEEGAVFTKEIDYRGKPKTEFIVKKDPVVSFSQDEIDLIERCITFVCEENTAQSISDLSHDRVWHAAEDGEDIPYFTVFAVAGDITDSDREWARLEIEALGTL
jgi:antitoxin SocA-like protein